MVVENEGDDWITVPARRNGGSGKSEESADAKDDKKRPMLRWVGFFSLGIAFQVELVKGNRFLLSKPPALNLLAFTWRREAIPPRGHAPCDFNRHRLSLLNNFPRWSRAHHSKR